MVSHGGNEGNWRKYATAALGGFLAGCLLRTKDGRQPQRNVIDETGTPGHQGQIPQDSNEEIASGNGWHPEERHHRKRERSYWLWSVVFSGIAMGSAIAAAIFTGFSVRAGWQAVGAAREATIDANRAWIGTTQIAMDGPLVAGQALPLRIYYQNTGRGPALNLVGDITYVIFDDDDPSHNSPVYGGINSSCDKIAYLSGGDIAFSESGISQWLAMVIPGSFITKRLISGQDTLIGKGCIFYNTMGQMASTTFCYILVRNGQLATEDRSTFCQDGNNAN